MNDVHRPLIAHVVYRFDIGGVENGVVNLINRLPESSWQHAVIALTEISPSFAKRVQRPDVQYLSLKKSEGHLLNQYPRLLRMFRELQPAIVHTRNLAALEAVVPAWAAGVVSRIHGEHGRDAIDPDGARRRYQWVRRVYAPFVSRYVALSKDLEHYVVDRVGIAPGRVVQLYNGVDSERFHSSDTRTLIEGCPFRNSEHWMVGTVGRLDQVKDQVTLARAFVLALQTNSSARNRMRLVIVGDGALRADVERILHDGGVRELAWLAGERSDIPDVMRGLNCFVLPSLGEGVSNTILEAMACALPVVATKVGGNAELVDDGVTGRLVPAADPQALARAIVDYFERPEMARRDGDAGRARVEKNFSLDHMIDSYHQLYLTELRVRSSAARPASDLPATH